MNKILRVFALMFLVFISTSCLIPKSNPDQFYSAWVDWGSPRFPLIKPYAAFYVNERSEWSIKFLLPRTEELNHYLSISNIEKVSIDKGVIMVYSSHSQKNGPDDPLMSLYWFVIAPDDRIEKGFDNESDFLKFIKTYGVKEAKWATPDDLNRKFLDTGCLEWIPGCG